MIYFWVKNVAILATYCDGDYGNYQITPFYEFVIFAKWYIKIL